MLATACSSSPAAPPGEGTVGHWSLTGSMYEGRAEHASVLLADGRVLVVGGCSLYHDLLNPWSYPCTALATAEIYDPSTGIWTSTGSMSEARRNPGIALLHGGKVLVAGGGDGARGTSVKRSAELYDPTTGRWTLTGDMALPRGTLGSCCAVTLPSGKVLMAQGYSADFSGAASFAELYDPATGTWEPTGPLVTPRLYGARAVLLPSGQVLLAGGQSGSIDGYELVAAAETFDPETKAWRPTAPLSQAWQFFTLTPLPTGEVLLAGGLTTGTEKNETTDAALYSPATGTWRAAAPMHLARRAARAVLLTSGRVLVQGNWSRCPTAYQCDPYMAPNAELYDPVLDTWTLTPEPPRYVEDGSALVLLPSGQALLAGGLAQIYGVRSAQLFQE
jgi:hypothetical protein